MTSKPQRKRRSNAHNKKLSSKNTRTRTMLRLTGLFTLLVGVSVSATLFTSTEVQAGNCENEFGQPVPCTVVPEISALEGTAALAVIAAMLLLAWERRRRAV